MNTNDQRYKEFLNSPHEIKGMYDSYATGKFISDFCTKNLIGVSKGSEIIGDVILGFYKIAELPKLLQETVGVSADQAQKITSELIEFLEPVVRREEEDAGKKKKELTQLADTIAKPKEEARKTESAPLSEHETIAPIRTMNSDMKRVHGYGSLPHNQQTTAEEPVVTALSQEETLVPVPKHDEEANN